jgi:glycosylphosphatidylinositol transamidase (GPIT) subunit GPI8
MKTMAQELRYKIDESTVPDWTAKKTANTQAEDFAIIAGIAKVPLDERTWDLLITTFHKEDTQVSDSVIRNFMFNTDEGGEKTEESQIAKDDVVKKAKDDMVKKVEINSAKSVSVCKTGKRVSLFLTKKN